MSSNKKKRKASAAPHGDGVALRASDSAEAMADKLLSLVPNAATVSHKDAKKLNRAFQLFHAELQHRSRVLAQNATDSGASQPLMIANVAIPEEIFLKGVFPFLSPGEVGWTVPLVSKAWLAASRVPAVWERLEIKSGGGTNNNFNMTDVLGILQQPHLSQVKHLTLPRKIKFGKAGLKKLAAACPLLESLDLKKMNPKDAELLECLKNFPHLTGLSISLWRSTGSGVTEFAKAAGARLQSLHVEGSSIINSYLHDRDLRAIAEHCPNLHTFGYSIWPEERSYYEGVKDGGTHAGLIALVQGCASLKALKLNFMPKLGLEFFHYLDKEEQTLQTLQIRNIECLGTPEGHSLFDLLAAKIPNLSIDD